MVKIFYEPNIHPNKAQIKSKLFPNYSLDFLIIWILVTASKKLSWLKNLSKLLEFKKIGESCFENRVYAEF